MEILNFGCSSAPLIGCTNIDIEKSEFVDEVTDLSAFPYKWGDNSIDGIYMLHFLEHFDIRTGKEIIKECHRILKPGGFLHIQVPHATYVKTIGEADHYRVFCYNTLTTKVCSQFKTVIPEEIHWIRMVRDRRNKYAAFKFDMEFTTHTFLKPLMLFLDRVINFLIKINPYFFERFWWVWVGGAEEIVWRGIKK